MLSGLTFNHGLYAQNVELKKDALMTGFLGLTLPKKENASNGQAKALEMGRTNLPSEKQGEKGMEEIIKDSTDYAIRRDEEYMLISLKSLLEGYAKDAEEERKKKETWIKVCAAEGGAMLLMGIGLAFALGKIGGKNGGNQNF